MAATAIAEYALAAAAHFARGLHEAARQKAAGQFTREGYQMLALQGATMGVIGLGSIGQEVARLSRAAGSDFLVVCSQVLLTPHISGNGDTSVAEPLRRLFADNLRRYLDGQPLRNVVDRARGY